jgi:hypothetical protein
MLVAGVVTCYRRLLNAVLSCLLVKVLLMLRIEPDFAFFVVIQSASTLSLVKVAMMTLWNRLSYHMFTVIWPMNWPG